MQPLTNYIIEIRLKKGIFVLFLTTFEALFGAAAVIAKTELSLKLNHDYQVKLVKTLVVET